MTETNWQFYTDVPSAWEAMLADIAQARVAVDIDQYIFEPDQVGQRFFDLLKQKAAAGVRVRIICDAAGSGKLYASDIPAQLSEAGIQIYFYNPISPWRIHNFTSWFYRDHKKILVVDDSIAHVGGVGINDRMAAWRDTHIRVTGAIVGDISKVFAKMLEIARRRRYSVIQDDSSGSEFKFITSSPYLRSIRSFRFRKRHMRDMYIRQIRQARERVYLTTPYFIPDFRLFHALQRAARRGVDVRLIVPERSDIKSADMAAASYFGLALAAGIKICQYRGPVLHAKTAVIDSWASVGSANLDNLSFWFCYEGNVVSTNPLFVAELTRQFELDLTRCQKVQIIDWQRRPWKQKFLELLTWPVHNFL